MVETPIEIAEIAQESISAAQVRTTASEPHPLGRAGSSPFGVHSSIVSLPACCHPPRNRMLCATGVIDASQGPVHGRRAHRQKARADLGSELEMSVPSMASTRMGASAFRRLPQTRSDASQSTISASRTASS